MVTGPCGGLDPLLAAWCVRHLGSPPVEQFFGVQHLSAVHGVRLADGREVVLKVRGALDRQVACAVVHEAMWLAGIPCPRPLAGPAPLVEGGRRGVGRRGAGRGASGRAHPGGERRDVGGRRRCWGGCARSGRIRLASGPDGRGCTRGPRSDDAGPARPVAELGPPRPDPRLAAASLRALGPAPDRRRDRPDGPRSGPPRAGTSPGPGCRDPPPGGRARRLRGAELPLGAGS